MKTETLNPTKQANKVKNSTKLAQSKLSKSLEKSINALDELSNTLKNKKPIETKGINLLNEAKKETNKRNKLETVKNKTKQKASYKNCVIGTNNLMKKECEKLGYAIKLFIDAKDTTLTNRPISDEFTQYDKIKMTSIYEIIELAKKDSKLYKHLETIKGIQSKKGKFIPYYLGQKLFNEKREITLTKYVNSNIQEREIFKFD
jgi:hypothetical protein